MFLPRGSWCARRWLGMGRAGGLLPLPLLLCCLLLLGTLLPGGTVEILDEDTLTSPTADHMLPVSAESEVDLNADTTSPPLSTAPKDTGVVLPGTIGREDLGQTTEAVAETERPISEENSGSKPTTTVESSQGDTPAEVHGSSTAIMDPAPTDEVVPTDPGVTVEVVKTTQGPSPPPRDETATLVVTQMVSSIASEHTSSQANLTDESTQRLGKAGATLQNVTELGDTTRAVDVLIPTTRATAIVTSTIIKITMAASTIVTPSADPTSKVASEDGKHEPSVLDVGDDGKDIPGLTNSVPSNTDPLVVAVVSVFIVMVAILAVIGFLRYRQRNNRTEFRRLQDLPMDDMMEDTPLSLYSY